MIDIHVLTHSGTKQEWLDQCLASLASEPCTVHVVEGVEGHVGAGRAAGFSLGTHPLVGFVDSDDYALPGVIEALASGCGPTGAVSMERILLEDGTFFAHNKPRHHLAVYRRDCVTPYLDRLRETPNLGERALMRALQPKQIAFVGYVWRLHAGGFHHTPSEVPTW